MSIELHLAYEEKSKLKQNVYKTKITDGIVTY